MLEGENKGGKGGRGRRLGGAKHAVNDNELLITGSAFHYHA